MSVAKLISLILSMPATLPKACRQCRCDYLPAFAWQDDVEEFCSRHCQAAFNFEHVQQSRYPSQRKQTFHAEVRRYHG